MNYHSLIARCISHIKTHPSEDITAQDLADLCGYSLYHLSSVFRACMGCSAGRYIMEERLRLAAKNIRSGRKISDAAMDSGFDTSSGFTKAFRKQFGCTPKEYRSITRDDTDAGDCMETGNRIDTPDVMEPQNCADHAPAAQDVGAGKMLRLQSLHPVKHILPEFVKRSALKVYGYVIPVEENHINEDPLQSGKAAFWSHVDFKAFSSYPEGASDYAEIGTWINPDARMGKMDYFFGYVTSDPRPAKGFHEICLAPGDYAVFRLEYLESKLKDEFPARIQGLWQYIFEEWFTVNGNVAFDDGRLCFEKYGPEDVEICVPIAFE